MTKWDLAQQREQDWWIEWNRKNKVLETVHQAKRFKRLKGYFPTFAEWVGFDYSGRSIDVGCGPCGLGAWLGSAEVLAQDPLVPFFREQGVNYRRLGYGRSTSDPINENIGRFNLIICTNVLDHTDNLVGFLRSLKLIAWNASRLYLTYDERYRATELHPTTVEMATVHKTLAEDGWHIEASRVIDRNPNVEPKSVHCRRALCAVMQHGPYSS